jgi:predicted transcriptional regulator
MSNYELGILSDGAWLSNDINIDILSDGSWITYGQYINPNISHVNRILPYVVKNDDIYLKIKSVKIIQDSVELYCSTSSIEDFIKRSNPPNISISSILINGKRPD